MLKLDPNERATIPEIFGHPWVRGTASGCPPMDIAMVPARDRGDDGEEDLDFAITYSPAKVALPGSPAFLSVDSASAEDKLPSIVSRSPSRIEPLSGAAAVLPVSGVGGTAASAASSTLVPTGTPGTGRTRPGRIMDNPLQSKLSTVKMEKHSPRPVMGALTPTAKASSAAGAAAPTASSSSSSNGPGNFKRNASSSTSGSSSRGRPRQGTANGSSGDKSHAERAAAHAGDAERLPVAHQKTTRRRSDQHPSEPELLLGGDSTRSGIGGGQSIAKKSSSHAHGELD